MNKKSWEREESPRVGLRLWLGGEKRFILPPKATFCSLSRDQCCSINCASLYRVNVMKKDSIYPQTQEYDLFCHIKVFCHSKRSQNNIQTPYTSTKMNEMSWEREESPRVGLSLWLGVKKDLFYPQRRHSVALTWSTLQYQLYKLYLCALELDKSLVLSFKTQLIAIRHIRHITKKSEASSILSGIISHYTEAWFGGWKIELFTPQRQLLLLFYTVCMVNVMKKDSIYSHNARLCSILSYPRLLSFKT